jgi:hypothetical protein
MQKKKAGIYTLKREWGGDGGDGGSCVCVWRGGGRGQNECCGDTSTKGGGEKKKRGGEHESCHITERKQTEKELRLTETSRGI